MLAVGAIQYVRILLLRMKADDDQAHCLPLREQAFR